LAAEIGAVSLHQLLARDRDEIMSVVTWIAVPTILGWLATLIMHPDLRKISRCDFAISVVGAGLAAALLDLCFGVSLTGPYGLSLLGTVGCGCGAAALLVVVNLARYGRARPEPPRPRTCWRQSLHGWQQGSTDL
jgi:uncharacterized membrane protein YeaQ/YmgE (transglycosylase-associated protein family)